MNTQLTVEDRYRINKDMPMGGPDATNKQIMRIASRRNPNLENIHGASNQPMCARIESTRDGGFCTRSPFQESDPELLILGSSMRCPKAKVVNTSCFLCFFVTMLGLWSCAKKQSTLTCKNSSPSCQGAKAKAWGTKCDHLHRRNHHY